MPKKMTLKKWNSFEKSTKKRALTAAFPNQDVLVDILLSEKPNLKSPWWKRAFSVIKDADDPHWKTYVNRTYYM